MLICMENDSICLEVSDRGAEMRRILDKGNRREVLWRSDPDVWTSCAPWLFPVVGQLRNHSVRIRGTEYAIPMHGFASESAFECRRISDAEAVFVLRANPETLKVYPWPFLLEICYRLEGAAVCIRVRISCAEDQSMDFSFGAHPGFMCAEGDILTFRTDGLLSVHRLEPSTHLLSPGHEEIPAAITLREELFDDDAMLIHRPRSTSASLLRQDGTGVRFDFGQVPWVGVWSMRRKGLKYVCIEPWFGVDDPVDAVGDMEQKLDVVHLPAGEAFEMNMRISPF